MSQPTDSIVGLAAESTKSSAKEFLHFILHEDSRYRLFQVEDLTAWLMFAGVFLALIVFDHFVLNNTAEELTIKRALRYTLFWISTAVAFCSWVWYAYGHESAFAWMSGYMLEWMLSFDNLFVFHLIFSVYGTPDHLKHRPLYLGICGAVAFRLILIFAGEWMMHSMMFAHFIFGAFLVYTGIKTLTADDDDDDPSENAVVQWLQEKFPFINMYDKSGAFFVRVPITADGSAIVPDGSRYEEDDTCPEAGKVKESEGASYGTMDFSSYKGKESQSSKITHWEVRATMLFLVVCCLEISDLIFAVDSVSAIVAQVPDLFLAYTSAVFAMLGLRATFFIIDVLVHMFELLKYGVSAVLIFVGVKLILSHYYQIPAGIVVLVLVTCIGTSILASVLKHELEEKQQGRDPEDVMKRVENVKDKATPESSPFAVNALPQAVR
eukprot:CAMPEP_0197657984 /NCGR_PEP_ID=MMETSP1338-20131121/44962_1 /TAXON_ID=43686 ORGANISM="Pelagodinium beii, Strain RCC1491" /NCGR_SAMPLE_ID=MMETSP1338 /ASSEMBLY_ACC=CAM_ASM_000754 /LENGTH=436 /DNA_ID=CAMNT_0043234477 /DNA_START=92 /DNA_END=1402 /DNA_ORIENTATION=+